MSLIEWVATAFGVLCVLLGVRRSIWTFPTAIGSVLLVGIVVWRARLYSDALLQLFFVAANLYGWINWRRSQAQAGDVVVRSMSASARWRWTVGGVGATAVWGGAMATTDAAYPWWDAATAVASVVAQLLMGARRWENWVVWIAVDLALIPLYLVKGLTMFAFLYAFYLALSVWGLIDWRRAIGEEGRAA